MDLDAPNLVHPHGSRLSASVPTPYSEVTTVGPKSTEDLLGNESSNKLTNVRPFDI